jgi:hypothetical protein
MVRTLHQTYLTSLNKNHNNLFPQHNFIVMSSMIKVEAKKDIMYQFYGKKKLAISLKAIEDGKIISNKELKNISKEIQNFFTTFCGKCFRSCYEKPLLCNFYTPD